MRKLLILGAGEMQVPAIVKAKQLGLFTIVADFDPTAPGFELADFRATVSTNDFDKILDLAMKHDINGVVTTSDYPVNVVAAVAAELNLPSMSKSVAKLCTDKFLQREFLQQHHLCVPDYRLVYEDTDLRNFKRFPLIVKPVDSSASRGVKLVKDYEELKKQVSVALGYSNSRRAIVEDFIEGREFSVETLTQNKKTTVVAITEKHTIGVESGYFVEDTHLIPARITQLELEKIAEEVKKVIVMMQLDNCPTHTEVKLFNDSVYIIEMACRLGGDFITSDLVPLATGVDMTANLIKLSLGEKIDAVPRFSKYSAVQFLNGINYHRVKSLIDLNPDIVVRHHIKEYHSKPVCSSQDRMGYVVLHADTYERIELFFK